VDGFLQEMPQRAAVTLEGRRVRIRAWKHAVVGLSGCRIPVYLLDTDLPENSDWDRTLTYDLCGGAFVPLVRPAVVRFGQFISVCDTICHTLVSHGSPYGASARDE